MSSPTKGAPSSGTSASAPADLRAVLDALGRIEARLDRLEAIADAAVTDGRHAVATATDAIDHAIGGMQSDGIDVDRRLGNLVKAAERLSSDEAIATLDATFGRITQIRTVLESGILDPKAVAIVAKAGRALAEAASDPGDGIGPFGVVRAIGEPDVRAATGFLVRFARRMGRALGPTGNDAPRLSDSSSDRSKGES